MRSADDGRGTVLRFTYARAAAVPGQRQRHSVLSGFEVESSGHGAATYSFAYDGPRLHSTGKFLLGFDKVTKAEPTLVEDATFANDDTVAGLLTGTLRRSSRSPGVTTYESRGFDSVSVRGVPFRRLKTETRGIADASGNTAEERTEYVEYKNDLCPAKLTATGYSGTLTTTHSYVDKPAFAGALACLVGGTKLQGAHGDKRLDFVHEMVLGRNDVGLVDRVESVSGTSRLLIQTVGYTPDWLVESVTAPGRGSSTATYHPSTRLPATATAPDGVVVEAVTRDPRTDAIRTWRRNAGTASYQRFFRFDGQERLSVEWDDLGTSTEQRPTQTLSYAFATSTSPASILSSTLVDPLRGSVRTQADLLTASGQAVTTARRLPQGWALDEIVLRNRNARETTSIRRATLSPELAATPTYEMLLQGAAWTRQEAASPFGHVAQQRSRHHADVEGGVTRSFDVAYGYPHLHAVENGTFASDVWMDASLRVLARDDESSARYIYTYDVLGRVRAITLPTQQVHRVSFDAFGRAFRYERDGIGAVELAFDPATGLLATRKHYARSNQLTRTTTFAYDTKGRVTRETHTDAVTGASKVFSHHYDGATAAEPARRGMLGALTGVAGPGYAKEFDYRADGHLLRRKTILHGVRSVDTALTYLEAGVIGSSTVTVRDGAGAQLHSSSQSFLHDAYGRVESVLLDGRPFQALAYDASGDLKGVTFSTGDSVTFGYDPLTRRRTSVVHAGTGGTTSVVARLNARGFVGTETLAFGALSGVRTYGYSPPGFLTSSDDPLWTYGYAYDASGLVTSTSLNGASTPFTSSGDTLVAGSLTSVFDASGRTMQRGEVNLGYGPDGQVATARLGAATWSFVHDEAGQRLMKLTGGTPTAIYLPEGYLDASALTQPVVVGGQVVGLFRNGVLSLVPTDLRGTVLAEPDGTPRVASPYGQRGVRPSTSPVLDYVTKGYDADLGLVRIGVRDFDPDLGRFTTPDPLFFAEPERCVDSPAECNLYGYARSAPTNFIDPSGECATRSNGEVDCVSMPASMYADATSRAATAWSERRFADAAAWSATAAVNGLVYVASTAMQIAAEPGNAAVNLADAYRSGNERAIQDAHFRVFTLAYFGGAGSRGTPQAFSTGAAAAARNPNVYETLFEAPIQGTSRSAHRAAANEYLAGLLRRDARFGRMLDDELGTDVLKHMESGKRLLNPPGTVWHHPVENQDVVRLLRRSVHQDPALQSTLHPGGIGGYGQFYGD
jgi:RHS repeat-associated protein